MCSLARRRELVSLVDYGANLDVVELKAAQSSHEGKLHKNVNVLTLQT